MDNQQLVGNDWIAKKLPPKFLFANTAQVEVPDRKSICPDRNERTRWRRAFKIVLQQMNTSLKYHQNCKQSHARVIQAKQSIQNHRIKEGLREEIRPSEISGAKQLPKHTEQESERHTRSGDAKSESQIGKRNWMGNARFK